MKAPSLTIYGFRRDAGLLIIDYRALAAWLTEIAENLSDAPSADYIRRIRDSTVEQAEARV